jgi:hypothetical protein
VECGPSLPVDWLFSRDSNRFGKKKNTLRDKFLLCNFLRNALRRTASLRDLCWLRVVLTTVSKVKSCSRAMGQ